MDYSILTFGVLLLVLAVGFRMHKKKKKKVSGGNGNGGNSPAIPPKDSGGIKNSDIVNKELH